jgi:hypothetical protein
MKIDLSRRLGLWKSMGTISGIATLLVGYALDADFLEAITI